MSQLENRFGEAGRKGDVGEKWVFPKLKTVYDEVIDCREDRMWQMLGVDFAITMKKWSRYYLVDSKHNLHNDGVIRIELDKGRHYKQLGWYFTSRSDRIIHVDVENEKLLWYDLSEMREYIFFNPEKCEVSLDKKLMILKLSDLYKVKNLIKTIY